MKILVLFTLLFSLASLAQEMQGPAFSIYKKDVHPIMYTYCGKCHNENASNPAGPMHSHSKPDLAFPTFMKFIDWKNPSNSQAIMMAANQHFCKTYNYNCEKADKISADFKALIVKYVNDVNAASGVSRPNQVPELGLVNTNAVLPVKVVTEGKAVKTGDFFNVTFPLTSQLPSAKWPSITMNFTRFHQDYFILNNVTLNVKVGTFRVRSVQFSINDNWLTQQTGYETLDRIVYMGSKNTKGYSPLSLAHPVIRLNDGDKLTIGFGELTQLSNFPSVLCAEPTVRSKINADLDTCYEIESMIDLRVPRRSVLLNSKNLDGRDASETLQMIKGIIQEYYQVKNK